MRLRLLTGFAGAIGMVTILATPASAHVTLHSPDAVQGGSDALLAVRVPNEEDNATTTQVEVDFQIDEPMLNVLVQPMPGWQFKVTQTTLPKPITTDDGTFTQVVTKVVWSGGTIPVGGYQDFDLDVSTLPSVPTLHAKALQTYSNGDVVRWIDPPAAAGQAAPDHPAPSLDLARGSASTPLPALSSSGLAKKGDVNSAKTISIVALVVGIIGLLGAIAAAVSKRGWRT